jgi:hypothetical protein
MDDRQGFQTVSTTTTGSGPGGGPRIEHKHGLSEWSPMLPERSSESVVLDSEPQDRLYRCQRVGCTEVIRIDGGNAEGGEITSS